MREIVTLSITSFRGSIGGEHYYGAFSVRTKMTPQIQADGSTRLITRNGHGVRPHPHDRHELTRVLGAKDAAYLNKKDGGFLGALGSMLSPGDTTTRFDDVPSIVAAAMEAFPRLFDDTDMLMRSRDRHGEDLDILIGPDEAKSAFGTITDADEREEWLVANGYRIIEPEASASSGGTVQEPRP
jgi:hypothetical protein